METIRRRIQFGFKTIMAVVLITAAGSPTTEASQATRLSARQTVAVTDSAGRSVRVPMEITRIGCLYAFSGHAVILLGRGADIVAVSNGLKRDSLLHRICPAILGARVPKYQGAINIEELLQARPDVLFVPADVSRNRAEMKKLDRFKIPWLVVNYSSIMEQQATIAMMGKALGRMERAAAYNSYYNACIKRVQAGTAAVAAAQRPRLYHSLNEATRTTLNHSLTTDWLGVAGVVNVALEQPPQLFQGKNFVNLEQILLWDPDVILANEPAVKAHILHASQWAPLQAVKNGRVYQMPIGISRWGHPGSIETPLAILWTAKMIYPESFPDLDLRAETKHYYQEFFNFELTDELAARVLNGDLQRLPKRRRSN
jgi:iron complex transport system substrate-binding protein